MKLGEDALIDKPADYTGALAREADTLRRLMTAEFECRQAKEVAGLATGRCKALESALVQAGLAVTREVHRTERKEERRDWMVLLNEINRLLRD